MINVTRESILQAYKKTGLKPISGVWLEGDHACPVVALLIAEYGVQRTWEIVLSLMTHTIIRSQTLQNFERGFNLSSFLKGWEGLEGSDKLGKELRKELLNKCIS